MTHYNFRNMDGYIGVNLFHVAPELPKVWYKMLPSEFRYIENVLKYAEILNEMLPSIKDGTANREGADDINIKYNDAVKDLRKNIFGEYYKEIEYFTYELNIDKDAIRIRVNKDASRGEAEAFLNLIIKAPGFVKEDHDYNPNEYKDKIKGENKNGKDNNNSDQG